MTILRDISIFWSLVHTFIMFYILFESRFPQKKTISLTLWTMGPLILINAVLAIFLDATTNGTLLLLSLTLPSLIFFWLLTKYRDGRFFFTFCMVDTVVLEILYISQIINYYTTPDSYIVMFILRLVAFPLIEVWLFKKLRPVYLEVQKQTEKGWIIFAVIGAIFYVAISLFMNHPTSIMERPEYYPVMILLFILMPVIYFHILSTLIYQKRMHEITEQDNILKLQVMNLTARMDEMSAADEKFRMERHNFRYRINTIAALLEAQQYDDLRTYLAAYTESMKDTHIKRYCRNAILDTVLSTYLRKAEAKGINVKLVLAFPNIIPVNDTELATVLANVLENAINACEKLEPSQRYIDLKILNHPRFIIRIANSYDGNIEFDDNGIPVNHEEGHGFGTRSIVAFCEKYDTYYQFKADDKEFALYLNF